MRWQPSDACNGAAAPPIRPPIGNHGAVSAQPILPRAADPLPRRLLRTPRNNKIAAGLLGVTICALWTWWLLADGAFFGTVLFPGAVLLYVVLALTLGSVGFPVASRGPHVIALAGLLALAAWTLLSLLWSPARDLAFDYAQRSFVYAAAFATGLLMTAALRRRMLLGAAPVLIAAAITTAVVLIRIWTSDWLAPLVDTDGTLDFPLGYRNANAAFFLMTAIGCVAYAARPRTGLSMRSLTAGLAATALALATISQSRGSVIGGAVGLAVLLAASRWRGRTLLTLGGVLLPVAVLLDELLDPYEAAGLPAGLPELQQAATAAVIAGIVAALVAAGLALLEQRAERSGVAIPSRLSRALVALTVAAGLIAVGGFAVSGPLGEGFESLSSGKTEYGEVEGSRFTYGGGLARTDFWRVASDQALDNPILGGGAGSFRPDYLLDRDSDEAPRNAHSVWLETAGELGFVGLILLMIVVAAAAGSALRSRRLGPEAATLSTIALAVGATWLGQASVDWFWYFGGLTAPVFALLGAAAAPAALSFDPIGAAPRRAGMALACVLALLAIPTFAAERLTLEASRGWPSDLEGAYSALGTAADLNPFADTPFLVESEIARRSGDPVRALEAARAGAERDPDDWRTHLQAARAAAATDPELAMLEVEAGLALNPRSPELANVESKLERELATPTEVPVPEIEVPVPEDDGVPSTPRPPLTQTPPVD